MITGFCHLRSTISETRSQAANTTICRFKRSPTLTNCARKRANFMSKAFALPEFCGEPIVGDHLRECISQRLRYQHPFPQRTNVWRFVACSISVILLIPTLVSYKLMRSAIFACVSSASATRPNFSKVIIGQYFLYNNKIYMS